MPKTRGKGARPEVKSEKDTNGDEADCSGGASKGFSGFKFEDVALYKWLLLLEGRMGRLGKKVKYLQEAKVEDKRMQSEVKSRIRALEDRNRDN